MGSETAKRESKDVTALLCQASQQLRIGEMIHGEDFDLAKVMNAVEIGDPRLDAGIPSPTPSGAEAAELATDLSPRQVLDVMDHMMVLEATWYSGSNLAQTVYTCRYLLEQDRIKHLRHLSAYMDSAKALAKIISDTIIAAGVASEEDIFAYNFGIEFPLGPDVLTATAAVVLAVIREATSKHEDLTEQISSRLLFRHSFVMLIKHMWYSVNYLQRSNDVSIGNGASIGSPGGMISFVMSDISGNALLSIVVHSYMSTTYGKQTTKNEPMDSAVQGPFLSSKLKCLPSEQSQWKQALARISANNKQDIEDGKKLLYKALAELQKINLDRGPSASPPPGFVPDIHRQRSGPLASRKVSILSGSQAHQQFQSLLEELIDVCRIAKVCDAPLP